MVVAACRRRSSRRSRDTDPKSAAAGVIGLTGCGASDLPGQGPRVLSWSSLSRMGFMAVEQRLDGGFVSDVVRVGATVRKSPPRDPAFVRRLLRLFESAGWTGAPRFLGVDERGRETLSFVDGVVPWQPGSEPRDDESLAAVARLVRGFHDVTAGTELAVGGEVVCHNDLSPKNTVYRAGLPVAFIDWDIAAAGRRVQDVAHVCWQFVPLGPSVDVAVAVAARRVRLMADAYDGLSPALGVFPMAGPNDDLSPALGDLSSGDGVSPVLDRGELVDVVLWWQNRCWRGIESAAAGGDPAMVRLRDAGVVGTVRAAYAWTLAHRNALAPE